jgi:stage II sporulation protein D
MKNAWCGTVFLFLVIFAAGCASRTPLSARKTAAGSGSRPSVEPFLIRVLVEKETRILDLVIRDGFIEHDGLPSALPEKCRIELSDAGVNVSGKLYPATVAIVGSPPLVLNGKPYIGRLRIENGLIVNELPLEEYLTGVLASEMGGSWPAEALKAQAVVSRTYAFTRVMRNRDAPYDLENTALHQTFTYGENVRGIKNAVDLTRSLIVLYGGSPIEAFYHASSGGETESSGDVFQRDLPYLRGFPDPYSREHADVGWSVSMSGTEIKEALFGILEKDLVESPLRDVRAASKTESGRVKEFLLLFGENRKLTVGGNRFRLTLGPKLLKSLLLSDIRKEGNGGDVRFVFSGLGYGHGVGMSQWGARNMALQGFSAEQIIRYYYRGAELGDYHSIENRDVERPAAGRP